MDTKETSEAETCKESYMGILIRLAYPPLIGQERASARMRKWKLGVKERERFQYGDRH